MDGQRSVLIVDRSEENGQVLQTALERRGMKTFWARRADSGLEMAQRHHPDLIVVDLELDDLPSADVSDRFAQHSLTDHTPLVILGSMRQEGRPPAGEIVPKPYHYGPLIRRIEEILDATVD